MTDTQAHDLPSEEQARVLLADMPCLACGYNLRGLDPVGSCPECGHSNLRTVEHRRTMTKRELAALAFRVAAVWMALSWIQEFLRTQGIYYSGSWAQAIMSVCSSCLYMLVNVILWIKADYLAKHAITHDGPLSLNGGQTYQQYMSIAFSVIGMVYLVYAISGASWAVSTWLIDTRHRDQTQVQFVAAGTNLVIGCVLLIGAARLANAVTWLRTIGTQARQESPTGS